jgi:LacI family transcriptional regulator
MKRFSLKDDKRMKPTIRDVAKAANVSISTVSRVFNKPDLVAEDTRNNVLKAISDLEFQPNALARGLIYKRTQTFGVLVPDISNSYYAELIRGLEDEAIVGGRNLIICNTDNDKKRLIENLKMLKEKQVDGIVFTSLPIEPDYYGIIQGLRIPVVLASTHSLEYDLPSVKVNDEQAGYDAAKYLIEAGHEMLGMISFKLTNPIAGLPRYEGFMKAVRTYGLQVDPLRNIQFSSSRYDHAFEATELLLRQTSGISAIFAASDEIALGVISCLYQHGLKVPDDISVIGFDNTRNSYMSLPKITTVAQPIRDIGSLAVKKLEQLIKTGTVSELRTYLPHSIIERDSVKKKHSEPI